MACGFWLSVEASACPECGEKDLQRRARRIWGWLGIQRYNHRNNFGVNFIRLGRAIVVQDKGLFDWSDDFGSPETEYPVEIGGGRIVGEIHLDHAPVNFRKTDFDREHRAWTTMYEVVHGIAPLRPNKARAAGLEREDTPLVLLFDGFRRNDPGLGCLIPGNGSTAIHDKAKQWAQEFSKFTPGYETDEKWYAAAKEHDDIFNGVQPKPEKTSDADQNFLKAEGLEDLLDNDPEENKEQAAEKGTASSASIVETTTEQRFAQYEEEAHALPELDGTLRVGANSTLLKAFITPKSLDAEKSKNYAVRVKGGETRIYINQDCPLLTDFAWAPADAALIMAAGRLMHVYDVEQDPADFTISLLEQFGTRKLDSNIIRSRGESILERIRELIYPTVAKDPSAFWGTLSSSSKTLAEDVAVRDNPDIDWEACIDDGQFSIYLTAHGIVDLTHGHPNELLDGTVFTTKYKSWTDQGVRDDQVDRLCALLHDLRRMITGVRTGEPRELARYALSVDLLREEIVP